MRTERYETAFGRIWTRLVRSRDGAIVSAYLHKSEEDAQAWLRKVNATIFKSQEVGDWFRRRDNGN